MIRAVFYLVASGAVWFAEGFIFSRFLAFNVWQTALLAIVYLASFGVAATWLVRSARSHLESEDLPVWRYLSLGPMLTLIVGSFVSLPIMLAILALGKI